MRRVLSLKDTDRFRFVLQVENEIFIYLLEIIKKSHIKNITKCFYMKCVVYVWSKEVDHYNSSTSP
jgi:hypothetical protein